MARYINEDEFVAWVKEHWCADCQNDNGLRCRACWIDDAIDIVEEAPTADVAPKSEACLLTNEELEAFSNQILTQRDMWMEKAEELKIELEGMRTAANSYKMHYEKAKKDVAREIFEDLENFRSQLKYYGFGYTALGHKLAELKKKYTEDKGK